MMIFKERHLAYLPYTSALFIFFGVVKLKFYYYLFGIDILSYIELSEVVVIFFDNILSFVFLFIFLELIVSYGRKNSSTPYLLETEKSTFLKRTAKTYRTFRWAFNVWINGAILAIILMIKAPKILDIGILTLLVEFYIFLVAITIQEFGHRVLSKVITAEVFKRGMLALIFASTIFVTLVATYFEAARVKLGFTNRVDLKLASGEEIKSTDKVYYIGNTKAYVFIYDSQKKLCKIYLMSDVKDWTVTKR